MYLYAVKNNEKLNLGKPVTCPCKPCKDKWLCFEGVVLLYGSRDLFLVLPQTARMIFLNVSLFSILEMIVRFFFSVRIG